MCYKGNSPLSLCIAKFILIINLIPLSKLWLASHLMVQPTANRSMKELAWLDKQTKLYRRLPHGCNTKWKDAVRTTNSQPTDISCLCLASVTKKAYRQICICTELLTVRLKVSSIGCAVPIVSMAIPARFLRISQTFKEGMTSVPLCLLDFFKLLVSSPI